MAADKKFQSDQKITSLQVFLAIAVPIFGLLMKRPRQNFSQKLLFIEEAIP